MRLLTTSFALVVGASLAAAAPTCGSGTFSGTNGVCTTCPAPLATCVSPTQALSCDRGAYLTPDERCVRTCPPMTFLDQATRACTLCSSKTAATCADGSAAGATSCIDGWCLSSGQCYASKHIPEGTYCPNRVLEPCPGGPGVTKCDSGGATLGCNSNTGYHFQSSSKSCVSCYSHETWDPSSEKCVSASGTRATDVGGCAQGMGSSALVESCSEAGATTCAYRNALYDGRCFAPSCALTQQGS